MMLKAGFVFCVCLQGFNDGLEELCKIQQGWAVPDKGQRDAIRQAQKRVVSEAFRAFLQRWDIHTHIYMHIIKSISTPANQNTPAVWSTDALTTHLYAFTDAQTFHSPKIPRNITDTHRSRWRRWLTSSLTLQPKPRPLHHHSNRVSGFLGDKHATFPCKTVCFITHYTTGTSSFVFACFLYKCIYVYVFGDLTAVNKLNSLLKLLLKVS